MKKALLAMTAAVAATAASGVASAQSASNVTLYGIADAGLEVISHVPGSTTTPFMTWPRVTIGDLVRKGAVAFYRPGCGG